MHERTERRHTRQREQALIQAVKKPRPGRDDDHEPVITIQLFPPRSLVNRRCLHCIAHALPFVEIFEIRRIITLHPFPPTQKQNLKQRRKDPRRRKERLKQETGVCFLSSTLSLLFFAPLRIFAPQREKIKASIETDSKPIPTAQYSTPANGATLSSIHCTSKCRPESGRATPS